MHLRKVCNHPFLFEPEITKSYLDPDGNSLHICVLYLTRSQHQFLRIARYHSPMETLWTLLRATASKLVPVEIERKLTTQMNIRLVRICYTKL